MPRSSKSKRTANTETEIITDQPQEAPKMARNVTSVDFSEVPKQSHGGTGRSRIPTEFDDIVQDAYVSGDTPTNEGWQVVEYDGSEEDFNQVMKQLWKAARDFGLGIKRRPRTHIDGNAHIYFRVSDKKPGPGSKSSNGNGSHVEGESAVPEFAAADE